MSKLILHIGMPKSGTTALQYFLSNNSRRLGAMGIIYKDYRGSDHSHNFLARLAHQGSWDMVDAFFSGLAKTSGEQIIVSSGPLFAYSTIMAKRNLDKNLVDLSRIKESGTIDGLIRIAKQHFDKINVIAYLRRQDKALESAYNQSIKNGTWKGGGITDFEKYIHNRLEYDRIAGFWAKAVGKGNLKLRIYDRQYLLRNDICADFLAQFRIPDDTLSYEKSGSIKENNLRLSRNAIEYKAVLNRIQMPRWRQHQYKRALREVDAEMGGDPVKWQDYLSPAERKALLDNLADSNRRLARDYFNIDSETPFDIRDLETTANHDVYSGLSTEAAMEIYIRLIRRMHSTVYKYETAKNQCRDWIRTHVPIVHPLLKSYTMLHSYFKRAFLHAE